MCCAPHDQSLSVFVPTAHATDPILCNTRKLRYELYTHTNVTLMLYCVQKEKHVFCAQRASVHLQAWNTAANLEFEDLTDKDFSHQMKHIFMCNAAETTQHMVLVRRLKHWQLINPPVPQFYHCGKLYIQTWSNFRAHAAICSMFKSES